MKRILLASAFLLTLTTACKKTSTYECSTTAPTSVATTTETAYLQSFLTANNITNAVEKNGMFYTLTQGSGTSPNVCNNVTIDYVGNLITGTTVGTQFDASPAGQPASFQLNGLIVAWQLILPLVKSGGTVTMYCPPSLAYGARVAGSIPANSYLKFVVSLRDVR
jgi:FKBP-type peptidyl-prolyl cis-trans isomerase FkpA